MRPEQPAVFRISDLEIGEELGKVCASSWASSVPGQAWRAMHGVGDLGQGFYGRVLKCYHKYTGKPLVLKELMRT
jgi:hypothetical protein